MASASIIGRQKEIAQLQRIYNSDKPELASKQHKPSHSLQVVLVTSFGLRDRRDVSCINAEVTLDDLFAVE